MPMTIGEARLMKFDGSVTDAGREFDVEYELDYSGPYDGAAATLLTDFTPAGLDPVSLIIGTELGTGSGVYVASRNARIGELAYGGAGGTFTIAVRANENAGELGEDPLTRKDVCAYRLDGQPVEIARDRKNRLIATYHSNTFGGGTPKPIEVFAQLPTVPGGRISATITGYRADYRLNLQQYIADVINQADPSKRQPFRPVNNAPIAIDGITWPKGSVGFVSGSASRKRIGGRIAVEHSWNVEMAADHNAVVLNAGNYEWDGSQAAGQKRQRVRDAAGNFRTGPWPLDAAGKALPDDFDVAQAVYLKFETTREADFSYFGWRFA